MEVRHPLMHERAEEALNKGWLISVYMSRGAKVWGEVLEIEGDDMRIFDGRTKRERVISLNEIATMEPPYPPKMSTKEQDGEDYEPIPMPEDDYFGSTGAEVKYN